MIVEGLFDDNVNREILLFWKDDWLRRILKVKFGRFFFYFI
jgi:hypothetical protein